MAKAHHVDMLLLFLYMPSRRLRCRIESRGRGGALVLGPPAYRVLGVGAVQQGVALTKLLEGYLD